MENLKKKCLIKFKPKKKCNVWFFAIFTKKNGTWYLVEKALYRSYDVLLKDLILENYEITAKSQIWVERLKSTQSRYQIFLVLSNFGWYPYFVPNVLSRIVDQYGCFKM